jgi:hypothetical protein
MKTNRIPLDETKMCKIKLIALKNNKPILNPDIVNLAFEIAMSAMENLDDDSFENVTGLKL